VLLPQPASGQAAGGSRSNRTTEPHTASKGRSLQHTQLSQEELVHMLLLLLLLAKLFQRCCHCRH
jgi:hypothetical protein